jgi:DNA-binding PucR family transcriptional regulator
MLGYTDGRWRLGRSAGDWLGFGKATDKPALSKNSSSAGAAAASSVTAHEEVELAALLTNDATAAREFVTRHLGPLADTDDVRMGELRDTLRSYLDHERSTVKVAADQHISRNTVTYRVQQAFRLCQHSPDTSPLRVHAALSVVDWLG